MRPVHCLECGAELSAIEDEGRASRACPSCDWIHYDNPTPVVAAISGQVSLVAVVANLLAAPAVGPATVLGLLGALLVTTPCRAAGHSRLRPPRGARGAHICGFRAAPR